jgi:hypothetical protein
MLKYAVLN